MINVSIVIYKNSIDKLQKLLESFNNINLINNIYIIDNFEIEDFSYFNLSLSYPKVIYICNPSNPGYGAAHNIALRKSIAERVDFHLVINPDVYFDPLSLISIHKYILSSPRVGQVMPRVLYPDGRDQNLCKLVPSPLDLLSRIRLLRWLKLGSSKFNLTVSNLEAPLFVPYLSGCFMFLRVETLRIVGLFDEQFFLYPEDIDLTRRIASKFETMYLPSVTIYHEHGAASHKSLKMFFIHAYNILKYFNKWGWVFDRERKRLNEKCLASLSPDNH